MISKPQDGNDGACDADCSLREAVLAANGLAGADMIMLGADNYELTIAGANEDAGVSGDLDITDDVTIVGMGDGNTLVTAAPITDRIFHVMNGAVFEVQALRLIGGNPPGPLEEDQSGGGIRNDGGEVSVTNAAVANNMAGNFGFGGGIFNNTGTLTLTDALITTNSARDGGGVYNRGGTVNVSGGTFAGNSASHNGGGLMNTEFAMVADATASVDGTLFINNDADSNGGAIYNGRLSVERADLTVTNADFEFNVADLRGGAIFNDSGDLEITGGNFTDNSSLESGGAISTGGQSTVMGASFSGNQGREGGAIELADETLTVHQSSFVGNSSFDGNGGAIFANGLLFIEDSLFNANFANINVGDNGGAIAMTLNQVLSVQNSTLVGNVAQTVGGAIMAPSGGFFANVTMIDNMASAGDDLYVASGALFGDIENSIIGDCNCPGGCAAALNSLGYNLEAGTSCGFTSLGDQQNTDPMLGPLQDNGGPTLTRAPLHGSPVIEAGRPDNIGGCTEVNGNTPLTTDQRGLTRPVDGDFDVILVLCDIGAVEFDPQIDADRFALNVTLAGSGTGMVTSSIPGINCPGDCTQDYPEGQPLELSAQPTAGSATFAGWSGACNGTGVCGLTMNDTRNVTATFDVIRYPIRVVIDGNAPGTITSSPPGINCPGTCEALFDLDTSVSLMATPDVDVSFQNWIRECSGSGGCTLMMSQPRSAGGVFVDGETIFFEGLE